MPKIVFVTVFLAIAIVYNSLAESNKKVADFINDTASEVIKIIESKETQQQKQENLKNIFHQSVDIDWMGRFSLGKYLRQLDQDKIEEYLTAYREFLTNVYVSKFTEYNGQNFYIDSIKTVSESQYIVATKVNDSQNTNGQFTIAYRIKYLDTGFKIRDIIAEGVSLILGQRSDFNSVISTDGIDSLIKKLKNKVK
ncbi:MlaC/ttg2D family ABC transporter substrate-binding protein [Candidatus Bandiella euplotis]|nr:ABC transporter substrate-binding protein [Candidatus Bandiella woodruffii]